MTHKYKPSIDPSFINSIRECLGMDPLPYPHLKKGIRQKGKSAIHFYAMMERGRDGRMRVLGRIIASRTMDEAMTDESVQPLIREWKERQEP